MGSHVMLDLETLGTKPGCAIVSIGACVFDDKGVHDDFYKVIDVKTSPLKIDPDTMYWWFRQSEEARRIFTNAMTVSHEVALTRFKMWLKEVKGQYIWGHGGGFDAPILAAAYVDLGETIPWRFWDERCTRTIYDLAKVRPERDQRTHHNALEDAKSQALAVIRAYSKLGCKSALLREPPSTAMVLG